ncbi:MAG: PepSY domain-containing protein [Aquabacterium sp.]|jgi:hypothetical protein|nr:MAG: PepSY domain-containing protein [Aquabacterium sp.]TAL24877.1 MAG: PepSY domain-containing protein [Aquabacterium sp.]
MKNIASTAALLLLALSAGSTWAHGNVKCPATPKEEWKPHTELQAKLEKEGWVIRQMKIFNNCYEVYAKDPNGKRIEAFFDPKTFERVEEQ